MHATRLTIVEKQKPHDTAIARVEDFRCRRDGRIDPHVIVREPAITLYCLDDRRRRAVFVETPPGVDLAAHAFYYQAQYAHAVRLVTVSYDTMHALAAAVRAPTPPLVVVFSLGRSGSTLVSRLFGTVPRMLSVSEPDIYTHVAAARTTEGGRDDELAALVQSATRVLCRDAGSRTVALKPRSTVVDAADLFHRVYPAAKLIFLHRDVDSWAGSMLRAFGTGACPEFVARVLARQACVADYLTRAGATATRSPRRLIRRLQEIPSAHALGLMWLGLMERAEALRTSGVPMLAMSYDTLVHDRERAVATLFDYCGVPQTYAAGACRAFDDDAQRGTALARADVRRRASSLAVDRHLRLVRRVIARCERS